MLTPADADPNCLGQHVLFDSVFELDHERAKVLCLGDGADNKPCPLLEWCGDHLIQVQADAHLAGNAYSGPEGTWAGKLLNPYAKPERRTA